MAVLDHYTAWNRKTHALFGAFSRRVLLDSACAKDLNLCHVIRRDRMGTHLPWRAAHQKGTRSKSDCGHAQRRGEPARPGDGDGRANGTRRHYAARARGTAVQIAGDSEHIIAQAIRQAAHERQVSPHRSVILRHSRDAGRERGSMAAQTMWVGHACSNT